MNYCPEVFFLISEKLSDKRDRLCLGFTCKTAYNTILESKKGKELLRFSKCLNSKGDLDCSLIRDVNGEYFLKNTTKASLDILKCKYANERKKKLFKLLNYVLKQEYLEYIEYSPELRDIYKMYKTKILEFKVGIKELEEFKWFYESEI